MSSADSFVGRLRFAVARRAGRLVGELSRRAGRGSGTVVRGRTVLAVDPRALRRLSRGRRSVIVSGTNGKSTTTRLVTAALGGRVATNSSGANMAPGLVTALDESSEELAVLEVDELHVPAVMAEVGADVMIALNLTRDQLDRTHEVSRISQRWSAALSERKATVVANAADPHVVSAALSGEPVWVDPGLRWTEDASVCPRCGTLLSWTPDGHWSCSCGLSMPTPAYRLTPTGIRLPDGRELPLSLRLPGEVNRGNAVFAVAAAGVLGVPPEEAVARVGEVVVVDGRYATLDLRGRRATLFLAKNPAGWAAALTMIDPGSVLVVGINARIADGTDTSWLYDVPFEHLAGQVVGVTGDRRDDLAVRIRYAGATPIVHDDLEQLAQRLPEGPLVVAANYTAFREMRRYVR